MANKKSSQDEQPIVDIKQRIVGAVVIISLAVIFLPMILHKKPMTSSDEKVFEIPKMPDELQKSIISSYHKLPSPPEMPEISKPEVYPVDDHNIELVKKQAVKYEQKSNEDVNNTKSKQQLTNELAKLNKSKSKPLKENNQSPYKDVFIVQLGTFSQLNNAQDLKNKLRSKHYKSYMELIKLSGKRFYRVRVGPFILEKQAKQVLNSIHEQFKIKGQLIKD